MTTTSRSLNWRSVALSDLVDELVFVGGATISLYITEPQVVVIRPTDDVDCVVEVTHRIDYEEFCKKLRRLGFAEDLESGVLCRFKKESIILDIMPTDKKILGFTNRWYRDGFKNAERVRIMEREIQIFNVSYFIAAKIEAFKGRGKGKFLYSRDIEDIVTVFDGRKTIASDLKRAPNQVLGALRKELGSFLTNEDFTASLDAHISDRLNLTGRKEIILERLRDFLG